MTPESTIDTCKWCPNPMVALPSGITVCLECDYAIKNGKKSTIPIRDEK